MNNFEYIHQAADEDEITLGGIIETVLCCFAMSVCLVAVMMLWLCG